MDSTFDPKTLASDLCEVHRIYADFFATLGDLDWDRPVKGGSKEWTLHETMAHLCHLTGDGLQSVKNTLRGEPYVFDGLNTRYAFNSFTRKGITDHLGLSAKALATELLDILDEAADVAGMLQPGQTDLTAEMSIYNRPTTIIEALGILMVHAGLFHAAQVAEPAGLPPLWTYLSPDIRHRAIGRTMRAFSLLYRFDIGGLLRDTLAFRVDGPGGGDWHVSFSPETATSSEGIVDHPGLTIHMRETSVFCQMVTGRLNLPLALISRAMKLRGDLRLFLRMDRLFSVDARP